MLDTTKTEPVGQTHKMEALGQFAGGIAHDFNNILSIIEGYTHIALRQLKNGTLTPVQLEKILKSTQRGAGLTRQLLSFGRQKVSVEEKTDLAEALAQQRLLLRPLLGESCALSMFVAKDSMWINAAPDHLTQIVLNLALNARDAMPEGGDLTISCVPCHRLLAPASLREKYPEVSFVRLSVVDQGTGIEEDILPRIFEPFFTTKDQGAGTGLGLAVVHGIVSQLKGGIEVSSIPGEGTRFDVYLPLISAENDSEAEPEEYLSGLAGKTILIAEDEPELRELLTDMFSGMDMKVLCAGNGNQALAAQHEYDGKIDFLLTDVVMPEMDGVKLGEKFMSIRPDSNIVYMSGYPFMDGRKDIQVPEGAPFIAKPLQEDMIRKVLTRALERRHERLDE